jgi:hypothetical protein
VIPLVGRPHAVLGFGCAAVVAAEAGYRTATSDVWLLLQAAIAALALVVAWKAQERLRIGPVVALAVAFQASLVVLHLALGTEGDVDSSQVFRLQGEALLDGDYPRSEYPTGAVLLFGLEALVGGGDTRVANALLMIPFHAATVAAIFALRTRWSPWLAAVVAFWPLNAYAWEFKFDAAPAALLAIGLLLAQRGRWAGSGAVLGLGTVVKWSPALAFAALVVWLVASHRRNDARRCVAGFAAAALLVYVPFLLWEPSDVLAAYTRQGGRGITAESVWYLFLRPAGLAKVRGHLSYAAGAPDWADTAAVALQLALVLGTILLTVRLRHRPGAAIAVAALAPAVFLLTNRIFSPQFLVPLFAAWAIASALLVRTRREQLAVGVGMATASTANAFVYPFALPYYAQTWVAASLLLFVSALALTGWLLARAARESPEPTAEHVARRAAVPAEG